MDSIERKYVSRASIKIEKGERMRLLRCEIERLVLMDDRAYTNTIPTVSNMW